MATKTLNTRITLKADTTANWSSSTLVLLKGEMAIEIPESGEYKMKIGDGVNTFSKLSYVAMTPTEIKNLINSGAIQTVSLSTGTNNGTIAITVDGVKTDNIAVKGLGSAAYTNSNAYAAAGHGHAISGITGLQTALDGKSATGHTHDDRYYTESEMNTKLAGKADTTVSDLNVIQATRNINSAITPNGNSIASSPFARDLWHDHLAFLNTHTIVSNQITTNGTTWSNDNLNLKPLFQQKECLTTAILSTNIKARRFTLNSPNIAWSNIAWFEFGVSYTNPFSNFSVLIEKSTDNSTWIKIAEATIENNCIPFYIANNGIAEEPYIRFTLTKTTNITTGSVCLTCIKGLSNRKGNQGLGIEFEFPYDWDADRNIYPYGNGQKNLGDTSRKWANVYANNFIGNASTATALTSSAGSSTQPVYFSSGKPVACGYTIAKSVPSDAVFTDTNTWRPLGTTGDTACAGNDSRLSNARPASDVYGWAKASSKPSYSWGEITGKPGTFNPSSHSHTDLDTIGTVGYYGSDVANSNGWYKVYSTTLTNYNDHVARLSIVSGYYPYASGLLILHLRCNNTTSLAVQQLIWETRQGFNADDVIINTNGNTWTLYLKITNTQYGRVKIRVLESMSTTSNWSMSLSNNSTKESTNPKATATAKDGATVNYANSAGSVAWGNVSGRPSSLPASDVYSWAKASSKPSYSKSEVGLGNVDNTADSQKSVKYATSAGNASTVNGHTVNADVPENAKFTDTTYSVATTSAAGLMSVYDKTNLTNVVNAQSSSYFTQDEINDLFS